MGTLHKALKVLETREKSFRNQAAAEMDKALFERFAFTNKRRFDIWLNGFVKIRVQEELVKAKTSQIRSYSDELTLSQSASLTEACLAPLFQSEDPDVTEEIERFSTWIERRIAPSEEEVAVVAKKKVEEIIAHVHDLYQENVQD